jgi:PST family polysaccharide transporter
MSSESSSHRQILKASAFMGGSSVISILVNILRTKIIAILLGPAGVGLGGMYSTIMSTAASLAGFGIGNSGVRQLAEALGRDDGRSADVVRRVLWYGSLASGLLGALLLWGGRGLMSEWMFGDASEADAIGWLGFGLVLSVLVGSQTALLQGFRRIAELVQINIIGTVLGAFIGILCVYLMGRDGILWSILIAPVASVLIAWRYASRLPRPVYRPSWLEAWQETRRLFGLGMAFMLTSLFPGFTQIALRALLTNELGLESVGHFQAAWAISMQYIGFVLGAMGTDYYPRLTAAIHDHERANRLVNEQGEMALLLAGPVILVMLTAAPLIISLLYADSFAPAVETLRWQVIGDLAKIFSWPMAFIILAQGAGRIFFWTESSWYVVYLLLIWIGLPTLGLTATGISFLLAYLVYIGILMVVVGKLNAFRWSRRNLFLFFSLILTALVIQAACHLTRWMEILANLLQSHEMDSSSPINSILPVEMAHRFAWILSDSAATLNQPGWAFILDYGIGGLLTVIVGTHSIIRLNHLMDIRGWLCHKLNRKNTRLGK